MVASQGDGGVPWRTRVGREPGGPRQPVQGEAARGTPTTEPALMRWRTRCRQSGETALQGGKGKPVMGSQGVILIVDDSPADRRYLERVLAWQQDQTVSARDGGEALELLQHRTVNLVLTDVKMPRLDGYELFESTRADDALTGVPFLFVTAYRHDSDVVAYGARIGADAGVRRGQILMS